VQTHLLRVSCRECESKENTYGVTTSSHSFFVMNTFTSQISHYTKTKVCVCVCECFYIYIYTERREKNESLLGSHGAKRAAQGPLLQNLN
jgi:hypothetical protein